VTAPVAVAAAEGAGGSAAAGTAAGRAGTAAAAKSRGTDLLSGAGLGSLSRGRGKSSGRATGARRLLVAEFVLCMVVLAFSPLTGKVPAASKFMKRGSAIMALFFLLGLISSAGRQASRAAAGFGGLVTLVLLISDRSIFTVLTAKFQPGVGETDSDLGGLDAQDIADQLGDTLSDQLDSPGVGVGQELSSPGMQLGVITGDALQRFAQRYPVAGRPR